MLFEDGKLFTLSVDCMRVGLLKMHVLDLGVYFKATSNEFTEFVFSYTLMVLQVNCKSLVKTQSEREVSLKSLEINFDEGKRKISCVFATLF